MNPLVIGLVALAVLAGLGGSGGSATPHPPPRPSGGDGRRMPSRSSSSTREPPGRPGKWFSWGELLRTSSDYDNTPTPDAATRLQLAVAAFLDPLREALGRPIRVTSAYRSPIVNAHTSGAAKDSQHMKGEAFDFKVIAHTDEDGNYYPEIPAEDVARYILKLGLPFDQLIWYHPDRGGHLHVSYTASGTNRRDTRYAPPNSDKEIPWAA